MRILRLLLVAALALTAQTRWESEATEVQSMVKHTPNPFRRKIDCSPVNILRGGGEKHSSRSKQLDSSVEISKAPVESEVPNTVPADKAPEYLAEDAPALEEEERFSYLKIAEKEIREAEAKEAKRNKEIDEYFEKRERGEIKLTEEQVRDLTWLNVWCDFTLNPSAGRGSRYPAMGRRRGEAVPSRLSRRCRPVSPSGRSLSRLRATSAPSCIPRIIVPLSDRCAILYRTHIERTPLNQRC